MAGCKEALPAGPHLNYTHISFDCTLKILLFFFFFNKLKVCGNTAWSKSIGTIFLVAFTHLGFTFW